MTDLPKPRGPLSVAVLGTLRDLPAASVPTIEVAPESADDAAVTLWVLHELSYGGFEGVDDGAESEPELVRVRGLLERRTGGAVARPRNSSRRVQTSSVR